MSHVIPPGSTIGVLGGGQLGRMLAIAAHRLGYRIHTLAPEDDTPTGQVSDVAIKARYDDFDAVSRFATDVDVVTFEFENVPADAVAAAEAHAIVRPNGRSLFVAQHRLREKTFLKERDLPVATFARVQSDAELQQAVAQIGVPAVLKTVSFGYDGKGQAPILREDQADAAWRSLERRPAILEALIEIDQEISVIGARSAAGAWSYFGPMRNRHRHHILDVSVTPAGVPIAIATQAISITRTVMDALDYVGVLCVEFFIDTDGRLIINEIAPRTHNSGHLTIDACRTSQFEQHVRAVCGLPIGSPELLQPAAMANLLGDIWDGGEPNWAAALALPDVKLHLYGKTIPRPDRKMGHLTVLASSPEEAEATVVRAREALRTRQITQP